MSKHTTITTRQINIPDNTEGTHIAVEYGCRFPDGHHEWGTFLDHNGVRYDYVSIVAVDSQAFIQGTKDRWLKSLKYKAEAASINPVDFIDDHTFVKRQVILVTTAAEEL